MTNTVCILTNFRCGSTSFTLLKSRDHDLPYKGELFSHERPWGYGDVLARWKELELIRHEKPFPDGYDLHIKHHEHFLEKLRENEPACFKLMPGQVTQHGSSFASDVANASDKVYLLYRRDWKAQALSWVAMRSDGRFGQNGLKHHRKNGNPRHEDFHWNMHVGTEYQEKTVVRDIVIDPNDHLWVPMLVNQLKENWIELEKLYREVPNVELVCMEDYFGETEYLSYNHEFNWVNGEPEVPEFDVEGLFK